MAHLISRPLYILYFWRNLKRICTCRCSKYSYVKLMMFCENILTCKEKKVRSRHSLWSARIQAMSPMKSNLPTCAIFEDDLRRSSGETPTSTVINLSEVFGTPDETAKFCFAILCSRPMPISYLRMARSLWKALRNAC